MTKPTLKAENTSAKGRNAVKAMAELTKTFWAKVRAGDKETIKQVELNTANNLMAKKGDVVDIQYKGLHKMKSGKTLFRVAFNGKISPSLYSMCGYDKTGLRFKSTGIRVE